MPDAVFSFTSTVCSFIAFALFTQWLLQRLSDTYRGGLALHGTTGVSLETLFKTFPLANWIERLIIAMLPTIQQLRKEGKFGLAYTLDRWDRDLVRAGLQAKLSGEYLLALCALAGLATGMMMATAFLVLRTSALVVIVFGFIPAAVGGLFIPPFAVGNIVTGRVSLINKRLPFAIEFLLLAMEARAAFPAAIEIYSRQIPNDPLGAEFQGALRDISYGSNPQSALKAMSDRVQSDDLTAFVVAIHTALDTGQPIKEVLKTQADACRQRRYESAERVAKTASTRATFPLFLVALSVLLLLVGPMAIKLAHESLF